MCVQSIGNTTMVPPLPIPSTFPLHFPPAKLTFLIQICKHFQKSFTKRKKNQPKDGFRHLRADIQILYIF